MTMICDGCKRNCFSIPKRAMLCRERAVCVNSVSRLKEREKSGSVCVCYVDFAHYECIYLITAYPKSEKDNLSKSERNSIAKVIKALENALFGRKG